MKPPVHISEAIHEWLDQVEAKQDDTHRNNLKPANHGGKA